MSDEAMKGLFSEEAEKAVLGCMMMDAGAAAQGRSLLTTDDFFVPLYRTVFQALQAADPPNIIGVEMELRRMGEWERVGVEWLGRIAMSVTTSIHIRKYAEKLKELRYFRAVVLRAGELQQAARRQDMAGIEAAMDAIKNDGCGAVEIVTMADGFARYIQRLAKIRASGKRLLGLPTGFEDLDLMLGGLRDGELNILAARPSMGKSALALDIARNAQRTLTEESDRVVVFTLEMPTDSLSTRGYTAEYLVDNDRFAVGGNDATWLRMLADVEQNGADFTNGVGRVIFNDKMGQDVPKMNMYLHGLRAQGINIRLIVIDYLQLVQGKGQDRVREIGNVSRGLKQMAKDWNCPLLALSQLSRSCELRADHRPMLSDLRDSGDIEQDADTVMFLYRDAYYYPEIDAEGRNRAELNIAKQRNGPIGTIMLSWTPSSTTFRSIEKFRSTDEEIPKEWRD